jgi:UDP-hydrolysing UDP-N-acetyl-D-glucosamine 2-epimerase
VTRRICVVTSSRADYGHLYWVLKEIQQQPALQLQVVATGAHLSPEFGLTVDVIETDGFRVDARVEGLVSSDTAVGVAKSIGLTTIGFADVFERLAPQMVLIAGDRFELLAAAQAALVARIPVAHIAGGDTTEGAYDEAIRHSITKMSHVHFVTNARARQRVLQLGEDPTKVFNFGSPGLDFIRKASLLSREQLQARLNFGFRARNVLVTFHPATLEQRSSAEQMSELLAALARLPGDVGIIITMPNADSDGRILRELIAAFVAQQQGRAACFESLGSMVYLSVMAQADMVVGNSSSGLYETPTLHKPTVNIGDRQRGRERASSVIDCAADRVAIQQSMEAALALDCSHVINPYGDGTAAGRIAATLAGLPDTDSLLQKHFHDLEHSLE